MCVKGVIKYSEKGIVEYQLHYFKTTTMFLCFTKLGYEFEKLQKKSNLFKLKFEVLQKKIK